MSLSHNQWRHWMGFAMARERQVTSMMSCRISARLKRARSSHVVCGYYAVRENNAPLVKGRRSTKFTPNNIARIKEWVASGVGRDEIANRLHVTVGFSAGHVLKIRNQLAETFVG